MMVIDERSSGMIMALSGTLHVSVSESTGFLWEVLWCTKCMCIMLPINRTLLPGFGL